MLPSSLDGFEKLVQWVMDGGSWDWAKSLGEIPNDIDVWRNLARWAFVRDGIEEARSYYVYNVLENVLDLDDIRSGWSSRAKKILSKELVQETDSLKTFLLEKYQEMSDDIMLELHDAKTKLFDSGAVTRQILWELENIRILEPGASVDRSKISNLIAFIAHKPKVKGYGYTKSVLWLNSCGVGKDYCAPSRPTIDFLKDYKGEALYYEDTLDMISYGYTEIPSYKGKPVNFWVVQKNIREVVNYLSGILELPNLCNGDINYAIWHYYKTKSLLRLSRKKKKFSPKQFLRFVDREGWDMVEIGEMLTDIDQQANVTNVLKEFVEEI